MIKEGYRRSNKNDATFQILKTYARIDGFRMHDMNTACTPQRIHLGIDPPLEDLREHGSRVAAARNSKNFLKFISQVTLKSLPDLLAEYYRRSVQRNITVEMVNEF